MAEARTDARGRVRDRIPTRGRAAEIMGVFARHNFYVNGLTPTELRTTLEDLGPTYVKFGQILSSRTDVLPEAYCAELERLRSDVAPLDASVARAVIEEEAGAPVDVLYQEFRDEPLGSASIAQAHYGVLADGTRVVTKVQRPGIADMMRRDFALLRKLASMADVAAEDGAAVSLEGVVAELELVAEEELDFCVEAENARQFRELCVGDGTQGATCPRIIDSLTTSRILTMTYVDGYSIEHRDRVEADGYDRIAIGTDIVDSYLHQVLDVGLFHGDPHQGNIMVSGGRPVWIDFGMVGRLADADITALEGIVGSLVRRDPDAMADAALSMAEVSGKVDRARLTSDVEVLMARYLAARNIADIDVGALMGDLTDLMADHCMFMSASYTMLVRSLVTMEGVLEAFCPELNLFDHLARKMAERMASGTDVSVEAMAAFQAIAEAGGKAAGVPALAYDALRSLTRGRIKVGVELVGADEFASLARSVLSDAMLALYACVLFIGACVLCVTGMEPRVAGMPAVALIAFILGHSLSCGLPQPTGELGAYGAGHVLAPIRLQEELTVQRVERRASQVKLKRAQILALLGYREHQLQRGAERERHHAGV